MNMHMPQSVSAETELRHLAAIPYQMVSPSSNAPIIGIYQDSLLGSYRFTRPNIKFSPRDAMNLLMMYPNVNTDALKGKKEITSFEVLSQIMSPITLKYKTKLFEEDEDDFGTSNSVLEIRNGKYIRGQIEKSTLASTTKGIIHRVCNDFGNMQSADFIDNLQNVVTEYMKSSSFSVGISDLIANRKTQDSIIQAIAKQKHEVQILIEKVHLGVFENNSANTNMAEFESNVNKQLNKANEEAGKIGRKSLSKDNRFLMIVNSGSKGTLINISQMISCLGQTNVDGKRIPYGFDSRTLPHFNKFDDSPVARGFIENSYISGLTAPELFFHAMGGRIGLIDTACKSVTWETPIVFIENGIPKYMEIGKWIDDRLEKDCHKVQHFTDRQMELLNIDSVYIPTTDENGVVTWGEVTAMTRHDPGAQLYEIKTDGGRSVIVTESKSLLIWNKETKKLVETSTPDIVIGDYVPVTAELCKPPIIINNVDMTKYFPKTEYVYGSEFNLALNMMNESMNGRKRIPEGWWKDNNNKHFTLPYSKKSSLQRTSVRSSIDQIKDGYIYPYHANRKDTLISDNFELNEENGIFIGLFLAEGNANKNNVFITNINENIKSFTKYWFDKHSITNTERSRINKIGGTSTTIVGNSSILSEFLTKFVGHKAENKFIPTEAFLAPESFIIGILNGYYSGDGTVSKNSIEVGSASKRLIEGISMLCSRIGIYGKMFKYQAKKNNIGTVNIKPSHRFTIRAQCAKIFSEKINLLEENKNKKMKEKNWTNKNTIEIYNNVFLDKIKEINIIGIENHPKVYDLTIPSTLNFGLANGLQVRDTSTTGYIQRRLIKGLEDLRVEYDMTVRNNMGKIIQFAYGDDGFDSTRVENQVVPLVGMSIEDIYLHYDIVGINDQQENMIEIFSKGTQSRIRKQRAETKIKCQQYIERFIVNQEQIVRGVFSFKNENSVKMPVAFQNIIANIQGQMSLNSNSTVDISPLEAIQLIEEYYGKLKQIKFAQPSLLFETLYYFYLTPKDLLVNKRFHRAALTLLLETVVLKYKQAIVHPGEMVGVIAGQSLGEPTTQLSVLRSEKIKMIRVNKETKIPEMISGEIGILCDNIITRLPEYTFNTGHKDSVETILEPLEDDYYIVGVDEKEKTHWNKISHVSRHIVNGDMIRVTTKSGRTVETTMSHSHLIRKDQTVQPILGSDMKVGMRIPVAKHIENPIIRDSLEIAGKVYELDYLFGWFIGAYLAEGCLVKKKGKEEAKGTISISNISEYYIENVKKFAERFDRNCTVKSKTNHILNSEKQYTNTDTLFTYKPLADLIMNSCGTGSFIKRVPNFAFLAPNEFKAGLVSGYMDGDGNFMCDKMHHQIRVCSRSSQLIKDISLLLCYFNIFGSLHSNYRNGDNYYHLAISPKYAQSYEENIGSNLHTEKLRNLVEYSERSNAHSLREDIDKINGLGEIISNCGKILELPGQSRNYGRWAKKDSIGRSTLEKYIELFETHKNANLIEDALSILRQAAYSSVIWDEIVEIEIYTPKQTEYVYDFTVPGNQTFMTDYAVIIHNTLNTFHLSGVASKSNVTRGVPRIEEILRLTKNPKNPSLTVYMKPVDELDKDRASQYAKMLEHTKLVDIVKSVQICFDPSDRSTTILDDKTLMDQYYEFEELMEECIETTFDTATQKSKWIIRMEMDSETLLDKNITMDDVHFAISNGHSNDITCIYSDYNAGNLVFRIRLNSSVFNKNKKQKGIPDTLDQSDEIYMLRNFQEALLNNIVLRGVEGIRNVTPRKLQNNVMKEEGKFVQKDVWILDTTGTNLMEIMALDFIDGYRTFSNDIKEIFDVLGIEAARQIIYNEFFDVMEFSDVYINYHHLSLLCDRMTSTKDMVSIFRSGILNDNIGPISKATFEVHTEVLLDAARHAEIDYVRGVSANVMLGQNSLIGTNSFGVVLDMEKMREIDSIETNIKDKNTEMEKLFGGLQDPTDTCGKSKVEINNNLSAIKQEDTGKCGNDGYDLGF
jgi:DNA-directed RNA polymerase beta' subunit